MEIKTILTKVTMTYWNGNYTAYLTIGGDAVALAKGETQAEAYEKLQLQPVTIGDLIGWAIPLEVVGA